MGLTDTVSQLIVVKADTSQAKAELRALRGVEKQAAKERLAELEAQNKGIDEQIAKWGKIAAGVGAAIGVFKLAQAAAGAYLEDLRLESAAAGINIGKLEKATRGLVETDNLLNFAGKAQHGVWKLTQAEMEVVAKGTDVLAKRMGMDLQPALAAVTEGIQKGQLEAFKKLGVEVKDKTGLMREMTEASKDWGKSGTTEGEKWIQAQTQLKNAWDDILGALGEIVVALAPLVSLIGALAEKIRDVADSMGGPSVLAKFFMGGGVAGAFIPSGLPGQGGGPGGRTLRAYGGGSTPDFSLSGIHANDSRFYQGFADLYNSGLAAVGEAWAAAGKRLKSKSTDVAGKPIYTPGNALTYGTPTSLGLGADQGATIPGIGGDLGGAGSIDSQRIEDLIKALKPAVEITATPGPTVLERIFGNPDQISATTVAIEAATSAVSMFAQAGAAAMGAWIDGSASMSEAIKKVLANSLKSVAMEATARSLFELAAAAASLAWGNVVSAGQHLKAAGMYGTVAVVAGVGAKAAHSAGWAGGGGGGGGGGPSGTSAGGYIGGNGYSGGGTSNTVIYVTGDAYRMSQAEREHRIADAARRGRQKRSSNVVAHE